MFNISKEEFKNLKPLEGENDGAYGACYYYDDGVLKVFFDDNVDYLKQNVESNLGINIENVAFPVEIGKVESKYAYKMKYIKGILLNDIYNSVKYNNYNLTFDDISKYYYNALIASQKISDYYIKINELHMKNCKFMDNNKFGIFDTDLYIKYNKDKYINVKKNNIKAINEVFYALLCSFYNNSYINSQIAYYFNRFTVNKDIFDVTYIDDALEELSKETKVNSLKGLIISK